jgi:hypothetical protein
MNERLPRVSAQTKLWFTIVVASPEDPLRANVLVPPGAASCWAAESCGSSVITSA